MSEIINLINIDNNISKNSIIELTKFIDVSIDKIDKSITIRNRKINFYDLFYLIIKLNIDQLSTYSSCKISFNINTGNNISKSAFINKLMVFDYNYLLTFNNEFINFYYKQFNLTTIQRIIAIDGSEIQLLHSLNLHFKSNSINTYTTGFISNLYDIDNNLPIGFDIYKSSNERLNLMKQLKYINKNDILTADRGYYSIEIINKLISLKINFVFRVKKNNYFILNNLNENEIKNKSFSKLIKYNYNGEQFEFKILKYCYVENIDKKYNIDLLKISIDKNNIKINKIKNKMLSLKNKMLMIKELIKNINKKDRKNLIKNRKDKKIIKNEISDANKLKYDLIKENVINLKIINQHNDYQQSSYFILTNLNINDEKIKEIYKKRWHVETCFKHCKTRLKMNNYDSKNINIIKQNIYATQFILILESFLEKSIKIKKDYYLNKNDMFKTINEFLLIPLIYQTLNKKKIREKKEDNIQKNKKKKIKLKIIDEIIDILLLLSKSIIKKEETNKSKPRIKKRNHGKNKWISRKKQLTINKM